MDKNNLVRRVQSLHSPSTLSFAHFIDMWFPPYQSTGHQNTDRASLCYNISLAAGTHFCGQPECSHNPRGNKSIKQPSGLQLAHVTRPSYTFNVVLFSQPPHSPISVVSQQSTFDSGPRYFHLCNTSTAAFNSETCWRHLLHVLINLYSQENKYKSFDVETQGRFLSMFWRLYTVKSSYSLQHTPMYCLGNSEIFQHEVSKTLTKNEPGSHLGAVHILRNHKGREGGAYAL